MRIKQATFTVNNGNSFTIAVDTALRDITWRKDNAPVSAWDGLTRIDFASVQPSDAGIYECHQVGQQSKGKHAIMRLIVRGMVHALTTSLSQVCARIEINMHIAHHFLIIIKTIL